MRVIGEIPHKDCKITLFSWNGKYLVKFEKGPLEQTYKVSEMDVTGDQDIKAMIADEGFMQNVIQRFDAMYEDLVKAMEKLY